MDFQCAHKGFSDGANHPTSGYIGRGNVFSDVQTSTYVRAFNQTDCNGMTFPIGQLRNFDLATFRDKIPRDVKNAIYAATTDHDVIVYQFFHFRERRRVEHGWLVTDRENTLIYEAVTGPTWRSHDVIHACKDYLGIVPERIAA